MGATTDPLISLIDWDAVDARTSVEQPKRERHSPWVGVFRWWARRPAPVVGALLDAGRHYFARPYLVSDVFSGGGTVAFEAASRRLPVYAQDLYPWPANGLATGLRASCPREFARAAEQLLAAMGPLRQAYYCVGKHELSHVIRVRVSGCPDCKHRIRLFRRPLISMRSRSRGESVGYMGCMCCGQVSLRKVPCSRFVCDHCRTTSRPEPRPTAGRPNVRCPSCARVWPLADLLAGRPVWSPVLVQAVELVTRGKPRVVIRPVEDGDPVDDDPVRPRLPELGSAIPPGLETDCLHRDGYRQWRDLYTNRQLRILKTGLAEIGPLDCSYATKERLRLAVLGAGEMAANLCRWEAYYPKAFEAMANHRYARTTVSTETNLLSGIGRGTLPRRFAAAAKAIEWWDKTAYDPAVQVTYAGSHRRQHPGGVLIAVGSSRRQLLTDKVVDLLLTDPPYHDDVQYGELARLFHAWLATVSGTFTVREFDEAVPNKYREVDTDGYRDIVAACLSEGRRTMAGGGRLVLTYHNNNLDAWRALGQSLRAAGFAIHALATAVSENPADHCKRGRRVFFHDLVIECREVGGGGVADGPILVGRRDTVERQNLMAAGLAMAMAPSMSATVFQQFYRTQLTTMGCGEVWIR